MTTSAPLPVPVFHTNPQAGVAWKRIPSADHGKPWITDMHIQPDMEYPDRFILTMDGPRGGEYGRFSVTRHQLLEMIVAADNERTRITIARQS